MALGATLYDRYIKKYAEKYNLSPSILGGVIQTESSGNPAAVSSKGALGLGQLLPTTAASLGVKNPLDPEQNIEGTAKLLRENLDATGQNLDTALLMYHGGTNQSAWGALTRAYPGKVLDNAEKYDAETSGVTTAGNPFDIQATTQGIMNKSIAAVAEGKQKIEEEASKTGIFGAATNLLQRGGVFLIAILLIGLGLYFIIAKRLPVPGSKLINAVS